MPFIYCGPIEWKDTALPVGVPSRSWDRLIFIMGIPILVRQLTCTESTPWLFRGNLNAICISLISWHRDCAGNWNHSPAWLGDRNLMGQALPHDTKFGNSRCKIVGRRVIFIWSLIHGSSWSGLIKAEPGATTGYSVVFCFNTIAADTLATCISNYGMEYAGSCLPQERISTVCTISASRDNTKCKHIILSHARCWLAFDWLTTVKYNRNTAWLRDTVRQTSRGKSAAAGRTAGPPRPLTSRGTSAWPYRVTTQYSFYPVQIYS